MPKLYLDQDGKSKDITQMVSQITWSGSKSQVARKLEISIISAMSDNYLPDLHIKNGSQLRLYDDSEEALFAGFIFFNQKTSQDGTITIVAYDLLIYTLKSKGVYNFKNKTAEEIASIICVDFKIPKGDIVKTGIKQKFIANNKTLCDIIMQGYAGASKQNGKKYMLTSKESKLNVIEIGNIMSEFMLSDEGNIIGSGYSESIENMVNSVKIYNEKGKIVDTVQDENWIKQYGLFQQVYKKEKDKQANTVAKTMLKDMEKNADVEALGNTKCITGNGVKVKEHATGLVGKFYIDSDTHIWKNGQHTMKLKLNFKNIMDKTMEG